MFRELFLSSSEEEGDVYSIGSLRKNRSQSLDQWTDTISQTSPLTSEPFRYQLQWSFFLYVCVGVCVCVHTNECWLTEDVFMRPGYDASPVNKIIW
jgi:hypothetical protein